MSHLKKQETGSDSVPVLRLDYISVRVAEPKKHRAWTRAYKHRRIVYFTVTTCIQ